MIVCVTTVIFSHANSSWGNDSRRQEAAVLRRDGLDGERHRDMECRDSGVYDGIPLGTDIYNQHRASVDKHRVITMGYQVSELRVLSIFVPPLYIAHCYYFFIAGIFFQFHFKAFLT